MSIRKLMTKVNLESEAEETVGATEEDILDVIESDEITAELVEASKEANEAAEADQELTDLAEEVTETIGDIEEKLEDTAEVEPEDVAVAQESLRHYKKMLGIKDEGTKISLESMRNDTKANLENIKVELEGVLDTIKDSAKKVWDWIISIFNKIKELFKAGYAKIVGFFKSMKWKNKPEQIKTADVINKEVAKEIDIEVPYITNKVYKEAVINSLKPLEQELKNTAKNTSNNIDGNFAKVNEKLGSLKEKMKSGEVTKKEEVTALVTTVKKEDLNKAAEEAMKSSYALFSLLNPVRVADAILDASEKYISAFKDVTDVITKLADNDTELTNKIKSGIDNISKVSSNGAYKYINDKCQTFIKSVSGISATDQIILVPRVGNSIAAYADIFNSSAAVEQYHVSDVLSERGKAVADKYSSEDVFKAYNTLDSKVSNVIGHFTLIASLTSNARKNLIESRSADKDIVNYFKCLTRILRDLVTFYYDYQKYLTVTIDLINKNTVNK